MKKQELDEEILAAPDPEPETHDRNDASITPDKPQSDTFKEADRALGCVEDPEGFRERVAKLVKHKPVEKPE